MNRYRNLISNIVNKQEKMLTESKIGTIFNEDRDYKQYYTTSWGATRYTNPFSGFRPWTKENSIHTDYSSQRYKHEYDLKHAVEPIFMKENLYKEFVETYKITDYAYVAYCKFFMNSHDVENIKYYGPFGTFWRFFMRIEGLNTPEFGDCILISCPTRVWHSNEEVRNEICEKIAQGRPYEVLNEADVHENNSKLYYEYQNIDKKLNLKWDETNLAKIGIDSDFIEEVGTFNDKTRIRAMADVVIQHGHPEIKKLKEETDKQIEQITKAEKIAIAEYRKEKRNESMSKVQLFGTYYNNWSFSVGSAKTKNKILYNIGSIVDANGQNVLIPDFQNVIPKTITIFTTQKLPDQLPDSIVQKINEQVNEVLSNDTRKKFEWSKSRYKDFTLPDSIKLPITISNIHK